MKILVVNNSDFEGGAARAAWRIHQAVRRSGMESSMLVEKAILGDWTVASFDSRGERARNSLRAMAQRMLISIQGAKPAVITSPASISSAWPSRIRAIDPDIVHLHWVYGGMMSIEDIARIEKPVVWTMHDMWPFLGAEHYSEEDRWKDGYSNPVSAMERLNRRTWKRKESAWVRKVRMVAPSRWMAQCALSSQLMADWNISVVPNAIDTDAWAPFDRSASRKLLGLPQDARLLAFGAMGGRKDPRKGYELLRDALRSLSGRSDDLRLVVFGERAPKEAAEEFGFPVHYLGHLHDEASLRLLYCAVDAMVIPSRQDNLPNTAVEALACGTPIVAFDACGLPDLVDHRSTGWLAKPFAPDDLAEGILWVIDQERNRQLGERSRAKALSTFSEPVVAEQYRRIYHEFAS